LSPRGTSSNGLGRRLIGCIVAYALVVQGVLFALSGARIDAAALVGAPQIVELCLHNGASSDESDGQVGDKAHCSFCLAAAQQSLTSPVPGQAVFVRQVSLMRWPHFHLRVAPFTKDISHQPRGPPLGV
jgi:hypothetical protein